MIKEILLSPIEDKNWPEEISDLLDGFAGDLNVYRTMAHHPDLLRSWTGLREHIVNRSTLGQENLEVVILRAGFRLHSEYEWSQHVLRARKSGLSDARIMSLRGAQDAMQEDDRLLANAVDELLDTAKLGAVTRAALLDRIGKSGVLDLMATVGFYSTLAFILNTFETPLDKDVQANLNRNPLKPSETGQNL